MPPDRPLILCVEDDPDFRDSLRLLLEAHGYAVVAADSGEQGLLRYKETSPDLVIVDLMMEEIDAGRTLVKELKGLGSRVPIFVLSCVGEEVSQAASPADLGVEEIFQKPVDQVGLLQAIEPWVAPET